MTGRSGTAEKPEDATHIVCFPVRFTPPEWVREVRHLQGRLADARDERLDLA
jgi:hypothetical protein